MEIFDIGFDKVVKSVFCSGKTDYKYAIDFFYPQIDKFSGQRKKLDEKFYEKLQKDIVSGCIMPAITIALVSTDIEGLKSKSIKDIPAFIDNNKADLLILDGIQRLNTLKRGYEDTLKDYPIYFNLLVSDKEDRLLYRMITLNNGQKPMSARHQIEVLAHNIFDFGDGLIAQTEKQRAKKVIKGSFNQDDIIKGYISYLSESVNIDISKIKLGHLRRIIVNFFISKYDTLKGLSQPAIVEELSQASMLLI